MNNSRRKAIEKLTYKLNSVIENARDEVENIQLQINDLLDEEQICLDALPESLQCSERGERMEDAINNLQEASDLLDDIISSLDCDEICDALTDAKE
jgi:DNA mismatch repair ATPase MutL